MAKGKVVRLDGPRVLPAAEAGLEAASCGNCLHCVGGLCRLWPPNPMLVERWPRVMEGDWCGQWRAR